MSGFQNRTTVPHVTCACKGHLASTAFNCPRAKHMHERLPRTVANRSPTAWSHAQSRFITARQGHAQPRLVRTESANYAHEAKPTPRGTNRAHSDLVPTNLHQYLANVTPSTGHPRSKQRPQRLHPPIGRGGSLFGNSDGITSLNSSSTSTTGLGISWNTSPSISNITASTHGFHKGRGTFIMDHNPTKLRDYSRLGRNKEIWLKRLRASWAIQLALPGKNCNFNSFLSRSHDSILSRPALASTVTRELHHTFALPAKYMLVIATFSPSGTLATRKYSSISHRKFSNSFALRAPLKGLVSGILNPALRLGITLCSPAIAFFIKAMSCLRRSFSSRSVSISSRAASLSSPHASSRFLLPHGDHQLRHLWPQCYPPFQRNCLKSAKVTAMIKERAKGSGFAPVNCIPMQLVSAINASALVVVNPGLMYVNIFVNGVAVLAMVDTGVNHKFVVECWYLI
nr:hypothetical protein CK203_064182 [Ipomoea trifida]